MTARDPLHARKVEPTLVAKMTMERVRPRVFIEWMGQADVVRSVRVISSDGGREREPPQRRPRASDEVVDQVVKEINALHTVRSLEAALGIGRIVVDRFYGGDFTSWRRHKTKEASFRKLAAREDLSVSATSLYR